MAQPILCPLHAAEREIALERYADDAKMLDVIRHAYATQDSLDADIRAWTTPVTGGGKALDWVKVQNPRATPYDYRRYARAIAAQLLFKVTDGMPHPMATRIVNEDKWSHDDRNDYWRCVAICSAAWID